MTTFPHSYSDNLHNIVSTRLFKTSIVALVNNTNCDTWVAPAKLMVMRINRSSLIYRDKFCNSNTHRFSRAIWKLLSIGNSDLAQCWWLLHQEEVVAKSPRSHATSSPASDGYWFIQNPSLNRHNSRPGSDASRHFLAAFSANTLYESDRLASISI